MKNWKLITGIVAYIICTTCCILLIYTNCAIWKVPTIGIVITSIIIWWVIKLSEKEHGVVKWESDFDKQINQLNDLYEGTKDAINCMTVYTHSDMDNQKAAHELLREIRDLYAMELSANQVPVKGDKITAQ